MYRSLKEKAAKGASVLSTDAGDYQLPGYPKLLAEYGTIVSCLQHWLLGQCCVAELSDALSQICHAIAYTGLFIMPHVPHSIALGDPNRATTQPQITRCCCCFNSISLDVDIIALAEQIVKTGDRDVTKVLAAWALGEVYLEGLCGMQKDAVRAAGWFKFIKRFSMDAAVEIEGTSASAVALRGQESTNKLAAMQSLDQLLQIENPELDAKMIELHERMCMASLAVEGADVQEAAAIFATMKRLANEEMDSLAQASEICFVKYSTMPWWCLIETIEPASSFDSPSDQLTCVHPLVPGWIASTAPLTEPLTVHALDPMEMQYIQKMRQATAWAKPVFDQMMVTVEQEFNRAKYVCPLHRVRVCARRKIDS